MIDTLRSDTDEQIKIKKIPVTPCPPGLPDN
jgi:hypothetical protein